MMPEREIILGCQNGRADCQRELVRQYAPSLLTVARRYAKDETFAKDILQEGFIRIFKAIQQYAATGSFEAWMRKIVINVALQQFDKQSFKKETYPQEMPNEQSFSPDIVSTLGAEDLLKLIATLPEGARQVFNLYAIEGYSHAEIASMLDMHESSSRSQLARARKTLQEKLLKIEAIAI